MKTFCILRFMPGVMIMLMFMFSCSGNKEDDNVYILAEKIQYDVDIDNRGTDKDWYVDNLVGPVREKYISDVMDRVRKGELKVTSYFNDSLSRIQIEDVFRRVDTLTFERSTPPYDLYDTIVVSELDYREITRLRFLEEWYSNEDHTLFRKKVTAICPMVKSYTEQGIFRGYRPLFWIHTEE